MFDLQELTHTVACKESGIDWQPTRMWLIIQYVCHKWMKDELDVQKEQRHKEERVRALVQLTSVHTLCAPTHLYSVIVQITQSLHYQACRQTANSDFPWHSSPPDT